MSTEPVNPYSVPSEVSAIPVLDGDARLAERGTRLLAAIVDGFLIGLLTIPIQYFSGFYSRAQTQSNGIVEQLLMMGFNIVVMLVLHGYLLATRGQTIGKWLCKIQIVGYESDQVLPFIRVFVLRYLWAAPFGFLAMAIPGIIDDFLVQIVVLVDVLMIFGRERRCLHDYIAGSKVVKYQPEAMQTI